MSTIETPIERVAPQVRRLVTDANGQWVLKPIARAGHVDRSYSDSITAGLPVDAPKAPTWSAGEVARWFFGKSSHWLRWLDRTGQLTREDGTRIGKARTSRHEARSYHLGEVEDMARLLSERDAITQATYERALQSIMLQAEIHQMFDDPYEHEGQSYPYTVTELAELAGKSTTWVRSHADTLGGVKIQWDTDKLQESWRFPVAGIEARIAAALEE